MEKKKKKKSFDNLLLFNDTKQEAYFRRMHFQGFENVFKNENVEKLSNKTQGEPKNEDRKHVRARQNVVSPAARHPAGLAGRGRSPNLPPGPEAHFL